MLISKGRFGILDTKLFDVDFLYLQPAGWNVPRSSFLRNHMIRILSALLHSEPEPICTLPTCLVDWHSTFRNSTTRGAISRAPPGRNVSCSVLATVRTWLFIIPLPILTKLTVRFDEDPARLPQRRSDEGRPWRRGREEVWDFNGDAGWETIDYHGVVECAVCSDGAVPIRDVDCWEPTRR
jgi:hypothetical protein